MTIAATPRPDPEIKGCCAALYGSDWARFLLGESFHPGGLALTERLGALLGLSPPDHVLDVAAGGGASALHLARRFGCAVTGVELSVANIRRAAAAAAEAGLAGRVRFVPGDAERLPFAAASFDAAICECALCTFPHKPTAAAELARVLRPGGRIGLSDLTRTGALLEELNDLLAWVACVADARPVEGYADLLRGAGLAVELIERHDQVLRELVDRIHLRLLGARALAKLQPLALPALAAFDSARVRALLRDATAAIAAGHLGYALLIATKPV